MIRVSEEYFGTGFSSSGRIPSFIAKGRYKTLKSVGAKSSLIEVDAEEVKKMLDLVLKKGNFNYLLKNLFSHFAFVTSSVAKSYLRMGSKGPAQIAPLSKMQKFMKKERLIFNYRGRNKTFAGATGQGQKGLIRAIRYNYSSVSKSSWAGFTGTRAIRSASHFQAGKQFPVTLKMRRFFWLLFRKSQKIYSKGSPYIVKPFKKSTSVIKVKPRPIIPKTQKAIEKILPNLLEKRFNFLVERFKFKQKLRKTNISYSNYNNLILKPLLTNIGVRRLIR